MPEQPPLLDLTEASCERVDAERISLRVVGIWREVPATLPRLMLIVDADDRRHRFPAVPRPRQAVGTSAPELDARFSLPAWLEGELESHTTLLVGESALELPPVQRSTGAPPSPPDEMPAPDEVPAPADPAPAGDGPPASAEAPEDATPAPSGPPGPPEDLLAPVRAELGERARTEVRLRAEIATLRARVESRQASEERLEEVSQALEAELVRVREGLAEHERRRSELESKAMVLAAELEAARARIEELETGSRALREERDRLSGRVRELDAELATARREAIALQTARLSAQASQEAALAQVDALHDEVERLAAQAAGATRGASGSADDELQRAEALLAQARSLTESLG